MLQGGFWGWRGNLDVVSMDHMALLLEFFDELAELVGEAVHRPLEAGQQVERHDDGEADAGDCGEEVLFHGDHLVTLLVGGSDGEGLAKRVVGWLVGVSRCAEG